MAPERTVREIVEQIIDLGIIEPSTPGRTLKPVELEGPLSYYGHTAEYALRGLLSALGIRYTFDYETFEGIGDTDHDSRLEWYRVELESIASCTRGSATVTNVRLVENGAKWELLFDWNGTTESWPVYPGGEREEMEAALIFATYLHTLGRDSVERLCPVYPRGDDWAGEAVFGNPEALDRLGEDFGLTFTSPFR